MSVPRTTLGSLQMARVLVGLWQVADMERTGPLDRRAAVSALTDYAAAGFDTFDMADHYGDAELIAGEALAGGTGALAFTKWCPEPGPMDEANVRAGIDERCARLAVPTLDLLQLHWWTFDHPAWIDALETLAVLRAEGRIRELGVTNFDAAHLSLACGEGVPLVSNQVSFSLLDRRASGPLRHACERHGVRLLAYGTLAGGFLSERWLCAPRPESVGDWSRMKYLRFIDAAGGWDAFQSLLAAIAEVARRHGVSIANVAARWVLEQPHVAGVIIGARLGEREHRADTARLFDFALTPADHAHLDRAAAELRPIPGDCGDEYRRPPYLTASGDLSHHLSAVPSAYRAEPMPDRPDRLRVATGSAYEGIAGYSRAVRVAERVLVSGTTATHGSGRLIGRGDPGAQATYTLDKIAGALRALGASVEDVVRTRILLTDIDDWEPVSIAHGRMFGTVRPANTLVAVGGLVGDYRVEIEAEAVVEEPGSDAPSEDRPG